MKYLGKHYILELYDCPADLLSDPIFIGEQMNAAALEMEATIVESNFHHFNPYGVSGVIIIKESKAENSSVKKLGRGAIEKFTNEFEGNVKQ